MRLRVPLAILTMVFAVLGLTANLANVDIFLQPLGDRSATHPLTAACLFAMGFGIMKMQRFKRSLPAGYAMACAVVAICVTRVIEELGGTFAISSLLTNEVSAVHGRFSVEAAVALSCFAVAAMLRQSKTHLGVLFMVVGLATVFNTLLEIAYGLIFFNGDVGAFTLLGMISLAGAMITVYIHRAFVRVFFLVGEIGAQTRIMAATATLVPALCGFYFYRVAHANDPEAPTAALLFSLIVWTTLVILMVTSGRHERSDAARRRAEREIALLSRTDVLTGALHRFGMGEVLE